MFWAFTWFSSCFVIHYIVVVIVVLYKFSNEFLGSYGTFCFNVFDFLFMVVTLLLLHCPCYGCC